MLSVEISAFEILAEVDILILLHCLSVLFTGMYVWKKLQCITEVSIEQQVLSSVNWCLVGLCVCQRCKWMGIGNECPTPQEPQTLNMHFDRVSMQFQPPGDTIQTTSQELLLILLSK